MTWDGFARDGREGSGGDFEDRPVVPEGVYRARVVRVGDPYDKLNAQSGEMDTKFVIEFELSGGRLRDKTATLASFPKLTKKFLDTGFLSDKATVFKIMNALGYDMESFRFNPPDWVGLECEVLVKNTRDSNGETSWITEYMRLPEEEASAPARPAARSAPRQAAKATAGPAMPTRRSAAPPATVDDWEE